MTRGFFSGLQALLLLSVAPAAIVFELYAHDEISRFCPVSVEYVQTGNAVLQADTTHHNDSLQLVETVTPLEPHELILRTKIHEDLYCLNKGLIRLPTTSETKLFFFAVDSGRHFFEKKIYADSSDYPEHDIAAVYIADSYLAAPVETLWIKSSRGFARLTGQPHPPFGSIHFSSIPRNAQIVINGTPTGYKTPALLDSLLPGEHIVELFLPYYNFARKVITVKPDYIASASFELIKSADTVYIEGDVSHGILMLPHDPLATPFNINAETAQESLIRLEPGTYSLSWNSGMHYIPLDTTVTIEAGRISWFDFVPQRAFGELNCTVSPQQAVLLVDDSLIAGSQFAGAVSAGKHTVIGLLQGYAEQKREVVVFPDSSVSLHLRLEKIPDRDNDSFEDSIDRCPDEYGIYNGCPGQALPELFHKKSKEFFDTISNDHLILGLSLVNYKKRTPTNIHFARFMGQFDPPQPFFNNYESFSFANTFHLFLQGFFAHLELGQWLTGISYRKTDSLFLDENHQYALVVDSGGAELIEPRLVFKNTSVSAGLHLGIKSVNAVYALGYQWEDLVLENVHNTSTAIKETHTFDNDWWYHLVQVDYDLYVEHNLAFAPYCSMKIPFGRIRKTHWRSVIFGLQVRFFHQWESE
ncbi:MAG: PEGA domain-containing protein [Chitinivibrionales bacterium]|nr:PEGA domain-containing protein [Chitinivibrionales bacterium]